MKGVEMGQATVDLPDPLEPRAPSAASTDELLAQLAGEEIDRLLAEADSELAGDAKIPPPASSPVTAPPASNQVAEDRTAKIGPGPAAANVSAELDDLFAQLDVGGTADAAKAATLPAGERTSLASASDVTPESESAAMQSAADESTSLVERNALAVPQISDPPSAPAMSAASPAERDERPPFYLRLLEWMNSPLAGCSDPVREAVGKIAILTTANAILILAYLLFLRKR